jgi:short-subunit dehydrogenase
VSAIDLKGKPIVITGAGSGIGRATAIACAGAGMPVALAGRRESNLNETKSQIADVGGKAIVVVTDVTSQADCDALIATTRKAFGSVYAVYANAGYGFEKPVHETTEAELRDIFETNFFGCMNTVRPALPEMIKAGTGHVLMCSSCIGKIGIPHYGPYCATKGAQSLIARSMRHELKSTGIHVTCVHPVLTATEFASVASERTGGSRIADDMPRFLVQTPERVARATVRALRKPRTEVWTSGVSRWVFALMIAMPRVADLAMDRVTKKHPPSDT